MGETLVSVCCPSSLITLILGSLSLDCANHPVGMGDGQVAVPAATRRKLHDPNIMFEEYLYYAKIQREQERRGLGPKEREELYNGGSEPEQISEVDEKSGDEKTNPTKVVVAGPSAEVTPAEWETASRAARNASWASM